MSASTDTKAASTRAARSYELLLILDPTLDERTVAPSIDQFLNVIRQDGGDVENVDVWGKRRLAYEIDKNIEGIYALVHVHCPSETVKELDRQLNLNESVLRTKITRPAARRGGQSTARPTADVTAAKPAADKPASKPSGSGRTGAKSGPRSASKPTAKSTGANASASEKPAARADGKSAAKPASEKASGKPASDSAAPDGAAPDSAASATNSVDEPAAATAAAK